MYITLPGLDQNAFTLTAISPGQVVVDANNGRADVDDAIGHDDVVIDRHDQGEDDHGETDTFSDRGASPQLQGTRAGKLTHGRFDVVHRFADENEQDDVGK